LKVYAKGIDMEKIVKMPDTSRAAARVFELLVRWTSQSPRTDYQLPHESEWPAVLAQMPETLLDMAHGADFDDLVRMAAHDVYRQREV
jgi:hypothetical protein